MGNNEKSVWLGGNDSYGYEYNPDGTLYFVEGKADKNGDIFREATAITNHTPLLKEYHKLDNGIEVTEELIFTVLRNYRRGEDTAITTKDILGQMPNLKFGAACRIFTGRGTKSRYSEAMQIQCENAPLSTVYQHTGYAVIDGERVFLNGENSVTKEGLTDKYCVAMKDTLDNYKFVTEKDDNRYKTLLVELPKVAPKELVYCGLALSFLTPLNALLREVGIEPGFILYFVGKTGSYKSTISKLFLNFFGVFDYNTPSPSNFKDTPNAVGMKMALTDSTLVLLDDRIPDATSADVKRMEAIEQSVARGIGDRASRGRLNSDMNLRTTPRPVCNLIITAEQAYSNVGESGIARSIAVELTPPTSETVQNIYHLQDNAVHLNMCMSEYIQYVLCNWDRLKAELKPLFRSYLENMKSEGHARLNTTVAHLQLGIYTMCKWLESKSVLSADESSLMQSKALEIFKQLAAAQNKRITDEKPVKMFIEAVRELKDSKSICFKPVTAGSGIEVRDFVGYIDDDFYYFFPGRIYSAVREYYARQGRVFPLNQTALFKQLADDGVVQADREQSTKTKRTGDGKRSRLLWVRVSALNNTEKEDE